VEEEAVGVAEEEEEEEGRLRRTFSLNFGGLMG
jgi:hypothetical protein